MNTTIKIVGLLSIAVLFGACVSNNPYKDFYEDNSYRFNCSGVIFEKKKPEIIKGHFNDFENEVLAIMHKGPYIVIGMSNFTAGNVNDDQAVEWGEKVHADLVYLAKKYLGTEQKNVPMVMPNAAFTSVGGTISPTIYNDRVYVPVQQQRYEYIAAYLLKARPGITMKPFYKKQLEEQNKPKLTEEQKQQLRNMIESSLDQHIDQWAKKAATNYVNQAKE